MILIFRVALNLVKSHLVMYAIGLAGHNLLHAPKAAEADDSLGKEMNAGGRLII